MLLETTFESSAGTDGTCVISVSGELDFSNAVSFQRSLKRALGAPGRDFVLDLTAVPFLDSAGLAAIVALHRELNAAGGRLAVASGGRRVGHMFDVTGINGFIPVADSRLDAIAALTAA